MGRSNRAALQNSTGGLIVMALIEYGVDIRPTLAVLLTAGLGYLASVVQNFAEGKEWITPIWKG